jgi:kynurenine formamidase
MSITPKGSGRWRSSSAPSPRIWSTPTLGWAVEEIEAITHTGTHVDAPYHYAPTSEGRPARRIDEVPFEWCLAPGVVLDVRHKARWHARTTFGILNFLPQSQSRAAAIAGCQR